jgi:hypothetical protein
MPFAVSIERARDEARRLEAENPLWVVVYGTYSKEFVCFPRFRVPGRVIIAARNPGELPPRMRCVENTSPDAVIALKAGCSRVGLLLRRLDCGSE